VRPARDSLAGCSRVVTTNRLLPCLDQACAHCPRVLNNPSTLSLETDNDSLVLGHLVKTVKTSL